MIEQTVLLVAEGPVLKPIRELQLGGVRLRLNRPGDDEVLPEERCITDFRDDSDAFLVRFQFPDFGGDGMDAPVGRMPSGVRARAPCGQPSTQVEQPMQRLRL